MAGTSHTSGICLKWNNHHNTLVTLLHSLLENKKLVDVTIAAEGKFINVHRLVLCASSPYFEELLSQHDKPAVIILQNVKFCDLELLVQYMYKGEIALMEAQLVSLLEAAENLQIQGLTRQAGEPSDSDDSMSETEENRNHERRPDVTIDAVMEANSDEENQPIPVEKVRRPRPLNQEFTINAVMEANSDVENQDVNSVAQAPPAKKGKAAKAAKSKQNSKKTKPKNKKADSRNRLYKCDTCGRDYQHKIFFTRHLQKGNCQFHPYFRCSLCDACENNRAHIRQHLVRFHRSVEFPKLDDYIIEVEPSMPKFACDSCPYRCKDVGSLRKHQKAKHNNNGEAPTRPASSAV